VAVLEEPFDSWFKRAMLGHEEILIRFLSRVWPHREEIPHIRQKAQGKEGVSDGFRSTRLAIR
jgi:RNA polymerase sigma-70 factor (ECF subfamily)